jgi:two-component system response regulator HydG
MMEKVHIERILGECEWNISRAARELDIDRQTLYNKIEKYGVKKGVS